MNIDISSFLSIEENAFFMVEEPLDNYIHISFKLPDGKIISFEKHETTNDNSEDGLYILKSEEEYIDYILKNNDIQGLLPLEHDFKNEDFYRYRVIIKLGGIIELNIYNAWEGGKYIVNISSENTVEDIQEYNEDINEFISILSKEEKKGRIRVINKILVKEEITKI